MKNIILLIMLIMATGCTQVSRTVNKVDPRLGELSNNILGVKNYRYEHVAGEPDQRLIIVQGSSFVRRGNLAKKAKANACPSGTKVDELGRKDNSENELKIVVWCRK